MGGPARVFELAEETADCDVDTEENLMGILRVGSGPKEYCFLGFSESGGA